MTVKIRYKNDLLDIYENIAYVEKHWGDCEFDQQTIKWFEIIEYKHKSARWINGDEVMRLEELE